jgi:hypothetical protein
VRPAQGDRERSNSFRGGYNIHHIVEQTSARQDGHSEAKINAAENLVRIPTLIHREITAWDNTKTDDFGGLSPRNYLRGKSWQERRDLGLRKLIEFGVLKP